MGNLSNCGFLVVKGTSATVPGLIGINIIGQWRPLVHSEFSTRLGKTLDSNWRGFQQVHYKDSVDKVSFARVAGYEFKLIL